MDDEEVILDKMEDTRTSLAEKLETLEEKVMSSVKETTAAVTDTVTSVKESVQGGVESVKNFMDVKDHVDRHPWIMVGGAVVCGVLLSNLLGGKKERSPPAPQSTPTMPAASTNGKQQPAPAAASSASGMMSMLEPEIKKLKALALGVALGTIRELITAEIPPHMAEQLNEVIDGITKKLGGEPIPSSDWDNLGVGSHAAHENNGAPVEASRF